jgi:heme/copper-type cytochrome/quinol oxidase subunit 2
MKTAKLILSFLAVVLVTQWAFAWEIDLSRRRKRTIQSDMTKKSQLDNAEMGFLNDLFGANRSHQEIVIVNTEDGFVPKVVRLKKDVRYTFYVVNVNEKDKNISFILDAFSEHHATYYGKLKRFTVTPKKEGVYAFQSPETSMEGRVVVYSEKDAKRAVSSED